MKAELDARAMTSKISNSKYSRRIAVSVKVSLLFLGVYLAVIGLNRGNIPFSLASQQAFSGSGREKNPRFLSQVSLEVHLDNVREYRSVVSSKTEKVIFCPIPKVASAEWLKVLRWIDGQADWEVPKHSNHGLPVLRRMTLGRANRLLNDPAWFKFAVVREPAERLLSCFLQKCNQRNTKMEYPNCPYLELWPDLFRDGPDDVVPGAPNKETDEIMLQALHEQGQMKLFPQYVQVITRRVLKSPCSQNPHWSPQWCQCSLDVTYPFFKLVRWQNMSAEVVEGLVSVASSPERGREIAAFVESRMRINNESMGKITGAGNSVKTAYSEEMLKAVHEAYAKDYELFSAYWE